MKQKFGKLIFVKVCSKMPDSMKHFESGFDAIVCGTYSQLYGGTDIDSYSLYVIRDEDIVNRTSWYREGQLTLCKNQDRERAEQMIGNYNFKR